ncbi:MAG: hypothetical protein JW974_00280 [Alphaproteobacteria bacterium]|nr:hypothetical protein [Alphaproteobacteria bacterium]MBN2675048.1 hypothetical protein [Alphaproteobacteria bacterium]
MLNKASFFKGKSNIAIKKWLLAMALVFMGFSNVQSQDKDASQQDNQKKEINTNDEFNKGSSKIAQFPVDSLDLNFLAKLPLDEFLKLVRSPGESVDIDSIFAMPDNEFYAYTNKSFRAPARTEVDTVLVHDWNKFEKFGKFYDAYISDGIYYSNLNLIKLNYYKAVGNDAETVKIVGLKNDRIKSNWFHEHKHAEDWWSLLGKIATLDLKEISEIAVHNEIAARFEEEYRMAGKDASMDKILSKILDDANKSFYIYIKNKQFITETDYMLSVVKAQLNMLQSRPNLAGKYGQVPFKQILRDKYTFDGVCLFDKVSMDTRIRLDEFISGVLDFEEFSNDMSSLKTKRKMDIAEIKSIQKSVFVKNNTKQIVMKSEREGR